MWSFDNWYRFSNIFHISLVAIRLYRRLGLTAHLMDDSKWQWKSGVGVFRRNTIFIILVGCIEASVPLYHLLMCHRDTAVVGGLVSLMWVSAALWAALEWSLALLASLPDAPSPQPCSAPLSPQRWPSYDITRSVASSSRSKLRKPESGRHLLSQKNTKQPGARKYS